MKLIMREFPGSPVIRMAEGTGLIPGWGTKIPACCVVWPKNRTFIMKHFVNKILLF